MSDGDDKADEKPVVLSHVAASRKAPLTESYEGPLSELGDDPFLKAKRPTASVLAAPEAPSASTEATAQATTSEDDE